MGLDVPTTPCDCLTVNPVAFGCAGLVAFLYYGREKRLLRLQQLLHPREESVCIQRAADAVLLCDVLKAVLGLFVLHAVLFVHEAIVSGGGRNESTYYYMMHMSRTLVDVAVSAIFGSIAWSLLIRYVNFLVAHGRVDNHNVFCAALRASGRYTASYAMHWDAEHSLDFRLDHDDPVTPQLGPSVLHHRVAARLAEEEEEDARVVPDTAPLHRPNPFEPLPLWWYYQAVTWCVLLLLSGTVVTCMQLVWRALLGDNDPLLFVIHKVTDAMDKGNGDLVCSGVLDGQWHASGSEVDVGTVLLSWLGIIAFHMIVSAVVLVATHRRMQYKGRAVHPAFNASPRHDEMVA